MKSVAYQSVAELGGRLSVLNRQKRDHIRLDKLLHRLSAVSLPERDLVLRRIYRLVFPHAFAEEAILWPVARRVLSDGHEITLRIEREHQEINDLVSRLELTSPGSDNEELLARLVGRLREDVRDEEDELLPRLQTALSPARLRLLGLAWEAVRWIAPTRAHPIVSRRPPGNVLSALPLAIVDRCRDVVDALRERSTMASGPLRTISGKLRVASHGIERLPGMQAGEDPATRRREIGRK